MSQLITHILKWIGRKLIILLVLVGILLVAVWVKNEWQRNAQARKDAKMLLERIDEKKSVLAKLQKKAANLSERAKQNLEELRSLD